MQLDYPRVNRTVTIKVAGRTIEKVRLGYAQFIALSTLGDFPGSAEPPKGIITATGVNRKHLYNDFLPLGWVTVKVPTPGVVQYFLTKRGQEALKNAEILGGAKQMRKAETMLARQREIAKQEAAAERYSSRRTRRNGAATNGARHSA